MKILITAPDNNTYARYFPDFVLERLEKSGEVIRNPYDRSLTYEELGEMIADVNVLVTHWGTPKIDGDMLKKAPALQLIAHAAGSVANLVTEDVYDKNIPVLSATPVMAKYVAESVVGYMIAGTHRFLQTDAILRKGGWDKLIPQQSSIFGADIGLIGLGTVGRILLDLLAPFGCRVSVYDPFIKEEALDKWSFAGLCDFDTAISKPIVSVHASKTPDTYHMIDEIALSKMADGALLINSARASIIDTDALIKKLQEKNIYAVIDVYDKEGEGNISQGLLDEAFCTMLQPHSAAIAGCWQLTDAVIDDIERFADGKKTIRASLANRVSERPLSQKHLLKKLPPMTCLISSKTKSSTLWILLRW